MKMLARILFLSSFAALPLFAIEEPAEPTCEPAEEKEVTIDEQETTKEVTLEEIKEAEVIAFADDKKDEAKDEQKEDSFLA